MFGVLYTKLFIQNNRHINMPIAGRLNDKGTRHDGYYETVILAGSPTVFIDGLPAARTGDAVDCGGVVTGSGTVNTG